MNVDSPARIARIDARLYRCRISSRSRSADRPAIAQRGSVVEDERRLRQAEIAGEYVPELLADGDHGVHHRRVLAEIQRQRLAPSARNLPEGMLVRVEDEPRAGPGRLHGRSEAVVIVDVDDVRRFAADDLDPGRAVGPVEALRCSSARRRCCLRRRRSMPCAEPIRSSTKHLAQEW